MKTTKEIKASKCKNCVFCEFGYADLDRTITYSNCLFPIIDNEDMLSKYNVDSYYKNHKSPKWCPLKKVNLKITHK